MTAAASGEALPWTAEIALRMRRLFLLKLVGTIAFTWLFFIGYFQLLRHPTQPPITMPLTALDLLIPFQPYTLAAYLSLWFYIGVVPNSSCSVCGRRRCAFRDWLFSISCRRRCRR